MGLSFHLGNTKAPFTIRAKTLCDSTHIKPPSHAERQSAVQAHVINVQQ